MRKFFDTFLIIIISTILGGLFGAWLVVNYVGSWPWMVNRNLPAVVNDELQQINAPSLNGSGNNLGTLSVADVVKKVSPSVVSIVIKKDISQNVQVNPFFNFFPDWMFVQPQNTQPNTSPNYQKVGGATGFIISADGLILTNRHVIADSAAKYSVILNGGQEYEAKVVGVDSFNDVGVVKIEAKNLPVVTLGDSDKLVIGQSVIAIGNALAEFSNTVTVGVVSGIGRSIVADDGAGSSESLKNVIQTDAAINPGNSGGPLLNLSGEVIGINTAVSSQGQLIGFAIPINSLKQIIASVQKNGQIIRPYLGVRYQMITAEIKQQNNLPLDQGALLVHGSQSSDAAVVSGSPADKAGLAEGDIIVSVNGKDLTGQYDLAEAISKFSPGDTITLKVWSKDKTHDVKITLDKYKN
ncbi:MAG: trypsin-like peptidase domain-containing protein [Patescibacteria group bacterium]